MMALTMCKAAVFFTVTITLWFAVAHQLGRPNLVALLMAWTSVVSITCMGSMGSSQKCLRFLTIVFLSLAAKARVTNLPLGSVFMWILKCSWVSVRRLKVVGSTIR